MNDIFVWWRKYWNTHKISNYIMYIAHKIMGTQSDVVKNKQTQS